MISAKQEMLYAKGINWNDYPDEFKRGSFVQRKTVTKRFSVEDLEKLPPKHRALKEKDLVIERSEICFIKMPPFGSVTNKVDVIFNGAEPII